MRIAVVSDIHGNLAALDAVIADLKRVGADAVIHSGDLVGGGASPAEVIDRVRDLGWPGVYGNAEEMLWAPTRVTETLQAPHLQRVRDLPDWLSRVRLGPQRQIEAQAPNADARGDPARREQSQRRRDL